MKREWKKFTFFLRLFMPIEQLYVRSSTIKYCEIIFENIQRFYVLVWASNR